MKTKSFLEKNRITEFINKYDMLKDGDRVVLGLSGGPDSVCLLFVLLELQEEYNLHLTACHVHHGIRGAEADRDEEFCRKLCEKQNVEYVSVRVDAPKKAEEEGASLEEAARNLRYEVLYGLEADRIAIAHNADDCAETVLFNLSRGSGIYGMRGIVPVRGKTIRPLLQIRKRDIEGFLNEAGIEYVFDSTNADQEYSRNKVRGTILPSLSEVNSAAVENICTMSEHMSGVCDYFDGLVSEFMNEHLAEKGLDTEALSKQDLFVQKMIIKKYLSTFMPMEKDVSAVHIDAVMKAISDCRMGGEKYVDLPHGVKATVNREYIFCGDVCAPEYEVSIRNFPYSQELVIPTNLYTKWFDYDKINDSVVIRTRQPGDYLIVNNSGGKKSLKDYMIDAKIPRHLRDDIKLACVGSKVLWVFGYRIGEDTKIDSDTTHILEISIKEK